jgi:hypothetical protein
MPSGMGQKNRGVPEEYGCTGYAAELAMLVRAPISLASEVNVTDNQVAFLWWAIGPPWEFGRHSRLKRALP